MKRSHGVVWLAVALGIAVMFTVAACDASPTSSATTAHITGFIYERSGIDPTPQPVEAKVTATPTNHADRSYSANTTNGGSFTLALPPGTYELAATMTSPNPGDQATPQQVKVVAGKTTHSNLYVNYP